ncbi:unnamed protein product, partial [Rotaria socialis]
MGSCSSICQANKLYKSVQVPPMAPMAPEPKLIDVPMISSYQPIEVEDIEQISENLDFSDLLVFDNSE